MQFSLFFCILINSILFIFMNHPLTLGFSLMIQTILISLFSGNFSFMFWFSYSLFLIFMGGMLILFMYMTSLASNEMFKFSIKKKNIMIFLLFTIWMILILYFMDFKLMILNNKVMNNDNNSVFYSLNFIKEKNNLQLNKIFNYPMNLITIVLVNYLFITLIATVKITNIFKGPLRPKTPKTL